MKKETRQYVVNLMEQRFQVALAHHVTTHIEEDRSDYVMYEMKDRSFYRGKKACFSKAFRTLEQMKESLSTQYGYDTFQEESYFYCDQILPLINTNNVSFKILEKHHKTQLDTLKQQCEHHEIESADINIEDYMVFGAYYCNILVSVASILLHNNAYDIGILTMRAYRGMHISTTLVRYCNNWIVAQGGISQYRCINDNSASYRTALRAGFEKGIKACVATKKGIFL